MGKPILSLAIICNTYIVSLVIRHIKTKMLSASGALPLTRGPAPGSRWGHRPHYRLALPRSPCGPPCRSPGSANVIKHKGTKCQLAWYSTRAYCILTSVFSVLTLVICSIIRFRNQTPGCKYPGIWTRFQLNPMTRTHPVNE